MPQLLQVRRVAKMLDVSPKRVYALIDEGKLAAIRLGPRMLRVTSESLESFIQNAHEEFIKNNPSLSAHESRKKR